MRRSPVVRRSLLYLSILGVVLAATSGLLAWQGFVAYQDFSRYQTEAAKQAVRGSSEKVAQLLVDLGSKVDMLAYAYRDDIDAIISDPENVAHNETLGRHVAYFFPGHFAFTLSDASGIHLYHDDFGERVGELCRQDLVEFGRAGYRQRAYIHPGPQEYHIDIMTRVPGAGSGDSSIFFVSFFPQAFATLLSNSEVAGHRLYLVREDQQDLIEIAAAGGRNILERDIRLSQTEIDRIAHRQPVPGSRWVLVDIPSEQLYTGERRRLLVTGLVTALVVLLVTVMALLLLARSDRALRRLETRYQRLIDSVSAVAWQAALNPPVILFMSRRIESMLGYTPDEFVRQPDLFFRLVHAQDQANLEGALEDAVQSGNPGDVEYRMRHRSGDWIWVRNIFAVQNEPGDEGRIEGLILDVTEQQRLQTKLVERSDELSAALKELEAFSYSVSHDLRSPLRAIDGFASALEDEYEKDLDSAGHGYISRIRAASQRMGMLIDDLLELARVSRKSLILEKVDITALTREVQAEIAMEYPGRKVELQVEPNITMCGDASLLRMVMQNLLENAWKFTGKTHHATIKVAVRDYEGNQCCCVSDNGVGFDMEYAGKLFGAFQRLHPVSDYPGTGIGLATVQRIIARHGGRVYAEAEQGKGARFYFCLAD